MAVVCPKGEFYVNVEEKEFQCERCYRQIPLVCVPGERPTQNNDEDPATACDSKNERRKEDTPAPEGFYEFSVCDVFDSDAAKISGEILATSGKFVDTDIFFTNLPKDMRMAVMLSVREAHEACAAREKSQAGSSQVSQKSGKLSNKERNKRKKQASANSKATEEDSVENDASPTDASWNEEDTEVFCHTFLVIFVSLSL